MCMACRSEYDSSRSSRTFVSKETIGILVDEISMLNSKVDFLIEKIAEMKMDEISNDTARIKKKSPKTKSKSKKKSKYISSEESSDEEIESNSSEDIVRKPKSRSKRK